MKTLRTKDSCDEIVPEPRQQETDGEVADTLRRKLLRDAATVIDRSIGGPDSAEIISAIRDGR